MATMVAVDLGAQSGRVALGRLDGERLTVREVHRFENVPVTVRGVLQWDVLHLFGEILEGLRAARRESARVDSVGVDSWAVDFGLLDRAGRLLANPVHYRDRRRAAAADDVLAVVPARALYERTGVQPQPINTLNELAAMAGAQDPVLEVAETLLLIPDLMHYWLGGRPVAERTNATTTQCFDPQAGSWAVDLLEQVGVPTRFLPEVVPPASSLGALSAEVAADTGLDAAIVAPATHDTASAVAAVPFRDPRSAYVSAGTWSLVGMELDRPLIDERTFSANLSNEGGVAGTTRLLRNVTGLWLLHECRRAWAQEGHAYAFGELVALAVDAPALRCLVDPDDPRFSLPGDMPRRIREYCAGTGQDVPEDTAQIVRCVLESLALAHAQAISLLAEATGTAPAEVHVVGGGARNEPLCGWTANAAELPVVAGPIEAAVVGNLSVQAMALGELGSVDEARQVVRDSFEPAVYEPESSSAWAEARGRFHELTTGSARAGVQA